MEQSPDSHECNVFRSGSLTSSISRAEGVGRMTNNPNLEAEGQGEQVGGKIQDKIGQVEKIVGL